MEKLTRQEKSEIYRFLILVLVIGAILVIMCLALGYIASQLPVGSTQN
ncbi:MAG: hypothetical protein ACLQMF_09795 [Rectinemataceae bacterium]